MITEHKLIKGTPKEIQQYIVSQIGYQHRDNLDITNQLNKIGLEKQGMIFYLQQVSDTEFKFVSIYVHTIDTAARENAHQIMIESNNNKYNSIKLK
jgi:hypothetical protein